MQVKVQQTNTARRYRSDTEENMQSLHAPSPGWARPCTTPSCPLFLFTPISKTDQMRRTGHAQTRRLPHEHAEPNCFEWVERCALNKYADNKHAKKNRYFSQQHFHNTTGIWRLRWEITNRSHAQVKLFHLVTPRRIHKIRELFSSEMIHHCNLRIQRPRHNRKECCNLCCRHPFRHRLDCTEVFFFHCPCMATNHGKELPQFFCGGTVSELGMPRYFLPCQTSA